MKPKKYSTEKNINKLKEVEVLISQGMSPHEASRQAGISLRTYYRWRKDCGRMRVDQAQRLISLEKENLRLENLVEDQDLVIKLHRNALSAH